MRNSFPVFRAAMSLLEVMLVVVVIGIIATVIMGRLSASSDMAKCKSCLHNKGQINSAIERFGVDTGSYPTDLTDLNVPAYFPDGLPVCPVTGSSYSINGTTHRVDGHRSLTVPGDH
jgi:prepilin-type N-terminal cleavage/methylation domain-containing protein